MASPYRLRTATWTVGLGCHVGHGLAAISGLGKSIIEYSGTASQIRNAYDTELHSYSVNGITHHANASDPQIPSALAPAIASIGRLNDFFPRSQVRVLGQAKLNRADNTVTSSWTLPNGSGGHLYPVGPKDMQTQYDLTPAYRHGITGAGLWAAGTGRFRALPISPEGAIRFPRHHSGVQQRPVFKGSPNCTVDANGPTFSLQDWPAAAGYDLATGLGSVDVDLLIKNWKSVGSGSTTDTTLTLNPARITHGQNTLVTTSVSPTSGSGTPTGAVALLANTTLPANKGQDLIPLANGVGISKVDFLPGGTYTIYSRYSGDGTFASSQSKPVAITVDPEKSTLAVTAMSSIALGLIPSTPIPNGASVTYGTSVGVDVQLEGAEGTVDGVATGTVTFSDNGRAVATLPLNSTGAAAYLPGNWAQGSHSITVRYSGDPSYNASEGSSPVTFTIAKGTPEILAEPLDEFTKVPLGEPIPVLAFVEAIDAGAAPTGTVTVTLGNQTRTATIAPTKVLGLEQASLGTVTFNNVPAGTYPPASPIPVMPIGMAVLGIGVGTVTIGGTTLLPTATTETITSTGNLSKIQPGTLLTLTATVKGLGGATVAPTGTVTFLDQIFNIGPGTGVPLVPGKGATSTATVTFPAGQGAPEVNTIIAFYSGDGVYNESTGVGASYTNPSSIDFSLLNNNPVLAITSGSTAKANLTVSSVGGFTGRLTFTCKVFGGPQGNADFPVCTVPRTEAVNASGQTAFAANFATSVQSAPGDQNDQGDQQDVVPAGTYTAVITGTNGITIHSVPVTIIVNARH